MRRENDRLHVYIACDTLFHHPTRFRRLRLDLPDLEGRLLGPCSQDWRNISQRPPLPI